MKTEMKRTGKMINTLRMKSVFCDNIDLFCNEKREEKK